MQNKGTAQPRQYVFCLLAPFGGSFCGRVGFVLPEADAREVEIGIGLGSSVTVRGVWPSGCAICVFCLVARRELKKRVLHSARRIGT